MTTFWHAFQFSFANVGYEVEGDSNKSNYGKYTGRYAYLDSRGNPTSIYERGGRLVWKRKPKQQPAAAH